MVNFHQIFNISNDLDFKKHCLEIFNFQYNNNVVYREFCNLICKNPSKINEINEIPFLPISFFKTKKILSTNNYEKVFYSSGTSKKIRSKHYISRIELYEKSFLTNFIHNYGKPEEYNIIGLLPSYLENSNSSLIYMVEKLIKFSKSNNSGFYMSNFDRLSEKLIKLEKKKEKTILIGVSYALLDLISYKKFKLKNTIVMETGGMKGQRKEMVKSELHEKLRIGFGVSEIHSEYGMTELLSQAYSKGEGIFESPPWMKVVIRDINDAQNLNFNKTSGAINIIDLANINSCSFIATDDMGRYINNSKFEVVGRIDNSDIRGCNLLI